MPRTLSISFWSVARRLFQSRATFQICGMFHLPQVSLNQLFADAGHIPRLQPMVYPCRGSDFAVAPLPRSSMDAAQPAQCDRNHPAMGLPGAHGCAFAAAPPAAAYSRAWRGLCRTRCLAVRYWSDSQTVSPARSSGDCYQQPAASRGCDACEGNISLQWAALFFATIQSKMHAADSRRSQQKGMRTCLTFRSLDQGAADFAHSRWNVCYLAKGQSIDTASCLRRSAPSFPVCSDATAGRPTASAGAAAPPPGAQPAASRGALPPLSPKAVPCGSVFGPAPGQRSLPPITAGAPGGSASTHFGTVTGITRAFGFQPAQPSAASTQSDGGQAGRGSSATSLPPGAQPPIAALAPAQL